MIQHCKINYNRLIEVIHFEQDLGHSKFLTNNRFVDDDLGLEAIE